MKIPSAALVAAAWLASAPSAPALERASSRRAADAGRDEWAAGAATCTIRYYNNCTGWVWSWPSSPAAFQPWQDGDRVGVLFEACSPQDLLLWTDTLVLEAGYGFATGTISVHEPDASGGPGARLASQPFVPGPFGGWNRSSWSIPVSGEFLVVWTLNVVNCCPGEPTTDHPAAGPTGPQACGTCFPSTRPTRSRYFGTASSPVSPGAPFFDGVCNAEIMMEAGTAATVGVEASSWGRIKTLYR
jgi:hypothetical protein